MTGDILLYNNQLVLYKSSIDLTFYVVGPENENEIMLQNVLLAFHDAVSMLLRHQVEKRSVLENLDLVVLALDETVDDGCVHMKRQRPAQLITSSSQYHPRNRRNSHCVAMFETATRPGPQSFRTQNRRAIASASLLDGSRSRCIEDRADIDAGNDA